MKKVESLIVGVDADGVLVNMHGFNVREGKKYFKKDPVNYSAYSPKEMYNVSKKEEFMFGLKVFNKYCIDEPPIDYAVEVITKLNQEGCELHEITARKFTTFRNFWGSIYRKMFEKWLKRHNLQFKSIQYCSETHSPRDKFMACMKLDVDVMIEDKPEVALYLAENGVKVLLVDAPYNYGLKHPNMIRVYDWNQIYDEIQKLKKAKTTQITGTFEKLSKEEKQKLTPEERVNYLKNYKKYIKNLEVNTETLLRNNRRFKLMYNITNIPFSIIFKSKIEGKENIPYQNGFIIASNHLNSYDQFYISRALGNRQFYGYAASTVKNTFRGKLFEATGGVIYIDRNDSASKQNGEEELATKIVNDQIALIFPEGTRKNKTQEGRQLLQLPFKYGTVSLAQKTGVGIIPISLYYGKKKYLKIGEIQFVRPEDDLVEANKLLEQTIANMTLESINEDNQKKLVK